MSAHHMMAVGLGELGAFYSVAALRAGASVQPVRRGDDYGSEVASLPADVPILVAVSEGSLDGILAATPSARRPDLILVQNSVTPSIWSDWDSTPTVATVWSAVKPGQPLRAGQRTSVFGKHAAFFSAIQAHVGLTGTVLETETSLTGEMVAKYAFILTINALGLAYDETVGALLSGRTDRFHEVLAASLDVGALLIEGDFDREAAAATAVEGAEALASMPARGRSAPARLQLAIDTLQSAGEDPGVFGQIASRVA